MRLDVRATQRVALRLGLVPQFAGLILLVVALAVSVAFSGGGTASLVIAAVAGISLLLGMLLMWLRPWLLRIDQDGYRVRFVRGAGVTSARWTDVTEAVTAVLLESRCLVLRLNGGQTIIPVDLLDADPDEIVRTIRSRLSEAHHGPSPES